MIAILDKYAHYRFDNIEVWMWIVLWGLFFLTYSFARYATRRMDEDWRKAIDYEAQLDKEERELIERKGANERDFH